MESKSTLTVQRFLNHNSAMIKGGVKLLCTNKCSTEANYSKFNLSILQE